MTAFGNERSELRNKGLDPDSATLQADVVAYNEDVERHKDALELLTSIAGPPTKWTLASFKDALEGPDGAQVANALNIVYRDKPENAEAIINYQPYTDEQLAQLEAAGIDPDSPTAASQIRDFNANTARISNAYDALSTFRDGDTWNYEALRDAIENEEERVGEGGPIAQQAAIIFPGEDFTPDPTFTTPERSPAAFPPTLSNFYEGSGTEPGDWNLSLIHI